MIRPGFNQRFTFGATPRSLGTSYPRRDVRVEESVIELMRLAVLNMTGAVASLHKRASRKLRN